MRELAETVTFVLFDWPYLGLLLAVLGFLFLGPREPGAGARLRDPVWVLRLVGPMYLVHQFEEHGIDALGRHYAFLGEMCTVLGFPPPAACPADPWFILAVNPVELWVMFAITFVAAPSRPLLAACAWGVPLVNAMAHIVSSLLRGGAYNPGLVTSLLLFLPVGGWMLRTLLVSRTLAPRDVPRIVGTGVAVHAVLLGSLVLHERGLPYALVLSANAAGASLPLLFARRSKAREVPQV